MSIALFGSKRILILTLFWEKVRPATDRKKGGLALRWHPVSQPPLRRVFRFHKVVMGRLIGLTFMVLDAEMPLMR